MRYDSSKTFEISYWDEKRDDIIQVHTDSLARAVIALITRSRKMPDKNIELLYGNDLMGEYKDGAYFWQHHLKDDQWQRYIDSKLMVL
jgi:hypothetical protein